MSNSTLNESDLLSHSAICFLLVNEIKELPVVAISSALARTTSDIYVGHIDPKVLVDIPTHHRIKPILIPQKDTEKNRSSQNYQDFGTAEFYELVQLKWSLFREIYSKGYKYVIYSDIDVVWLGDAAAAIERTFELFEKAHILVQSFTRSPNDSLLCMGIFAFRSSDLSMKFIDICETDHIEALEKKLSIGDDEIVTRVNRKLGFTEYVRELPQSTFAVGNFLDLYSTKARFPGVHKPIPLIFHCNYVVGLRNKRLMLRLALSRSQRKEFQIRFGIGFYLLLKLKEIKSLTLINAAKRLFLD